MKTQTLEQYQSGFTQQYVAKEGDDIGTGNTHNKALFILRYTQNLKLALEKYPEEYCWPPSELFVVVGRMIQAFDKKSYSKDSRAIKATCKQLGIAFTYAAINEFWSKPV